MAKTAVASVDDDSTDSEVASADAAIKAVEDAIAAAADLAGTTRPLPRPKAHAAVEGQLTMKKASIMATRDKAANDMKAAMAKTGKALHAALGPPDTGENATALNNIGAPTLDATGLMIDAAAGAGVLPTATDPNRVTLEAGASAGSLGGWMGMDYALTTGTGASKLTNEARVYTNKGPNKSVTFAAAGYTVQAEGEN